jgi:hypothetical protein
VDGTEKGTQKPRACSLMPRCCIACSVRICGRPHRGWPICACGAGDDISQYLHALCSCAAVPAYAYHVLPPAFACHLTARRCRATPSGMWSYHGSACAPLLSRLLCPPLELRQPQQRQRQRGRRRRFTHRHRRAARSRCACRSHCCPHTGRSARWPTRWGVITREGARQTLRSVAGGSLQCEASHAMPAMWLIIIPYT